MALIFAFLLPQSWTDEKLRWNETEYGGLKSLNLADHEIWQPDIFLYNRYNNYPTLARNNICIFVCIVQQVQG